MNIEDLTIKQARELAQMFCQSAPSSAAFAAPAPHSDMVGRYVIVRCKDAGVHAGELVSHSGRECSLKDARRLWYWKPANGAAFLSGVAKEGLHDDSKVGVPVDTILTENCEILRCTPRAEKSIRGAKSYEK